MTLRDSVTGRFLPSASPVSERLWARVVKGPGCWEWPGAKNSMGHGVIGRGRRGEGNAYTHRVAWESTYGPIPEGMCVCHKCDNPPCVRPDHLFLGTRLDNNRDMFRKGRSAHHLGTRRVRRGSEHHAATITEATARAIKASSGTAEAVAARFGIKPNIVQSIRQGRTWRHV